MKIVKLPFVSAKRSEFKDKVNAQATVDLYIVITELGGMSEPNVKATKWYLYKKCQFSQFLTQVFFNNFDCFTGTTVSVSTFFL